MLPSKEALSRLLGSLYDAAGDPTLWDSFLQQVAHNARAQSAAVMMFDTRQSLHNVSHNWQVDPEGVRLYEQYYGALDVWAGKAASITAQNWVGTSESLCSFLELSRTEYYNDFLRRLGLPHAMFSLFQPLAHQKVVLGVYRTPRKGEFRTTECSLLQFLAPHIERAFTLHRRMSDLKQSSTGMATALDMLPTGLVMLGARGEILATNRSAASILAQNDGLIATRDGLRAERPSESARLEKLIREAINTSAGEGLNAGGSILIARKQRVPLQVLVTPVGNVQVGLSQPMRAMVFVNDPAQRVRPAQDVLRAMFGLTPAECRVALLLGDGKSPREIAQILGVTSNTLKSHLASIYAKTNTSRQSQVVRLLMRLPTEATA